MVRPLTKHKQTGEPYVRPNRVEAEIALASGQDLATLHARCRITDRKDPDYVSSECLLYLIRDACRIEDRPKLDLLMPVLLERCQTILESKLPDSRQLDAASLREEILGEFAELIAEDLSDERTDELDFFECRFNQAFRTFRLDGVKGERRRVKRLEQLPERSDEDDEGLHARVEKVLATPAAQEATAFLHELSDAIDALPDDERKAVILRHRLGYEIESKDPNEETVATRCGVTGRTIQNRLSRAAMRLARFNEEAI